MKGLLKIADLIDALSWRIGQTVKWLAVALVLVQFIVVILRYAYGSSFIWMQESVIYIHATLFMMAIGYTYLIDAHVRVDYYYGEWSARTRAIVDIAGILAATLPFCALLIWASWGYVAVSWRMGEGAMAVGGLPATPFLKSLIIIMAGLLGIQTIAIGIRALDVALGGPGPVFPRKPANADQG